MQNDVINYIRDYNIIGIGEPTHGQKLLNILRFNIIKKLLQINTNKNIYLFIEDQYSSCKYLNDYINGKKINMEKYFDKLMPPIYKNIYFYKFIKWCHKYNKKNHNKIFLYGIDMRYFYHKPNNNLDNFVYNL